MLCVRDVSFDYQEGVPVLRSVGMDLHPGCVTVLLGPNGSGKSTLMQLMLGACEPRRGEVLLGAQREIGRAAGRELVGP